MNVRVDGAVLFDMDGTLVDREPLAAKALVDACAGVGWSLETSEVDRLFGRAWQDVYCDLRVEARTGWSERRFIDIVVQHADALATEGGGLGPLPGVVVLVESLRAKSVPLAVVTGSTRHEVEITLRPVGLLEHFDVIVAAEDYRRGKPEPESYLRALDTLRRLAARSVAVEDTTAGVEAARVAGLRVVGTEATNPDIAHPAHQDLSNADLVVRDLTDVGLTDWIEAILTE